MVGTSGATSRGNSSATMQIEVVAGKKGPQFDFCHGVNLTVPWRARLKLVHPSRPIQRDSLVSWWRKVEHCTQSRTHAMMQTILHRLPLRTLDSKCCRQFFCTLIETETKKGVIFDAIPTVIETLFEQNSTPKNTKFINSKRTEFTTKIEQ